jgi:hypothetical protein
MSFRASVFLAAVLAATLNPAAAEVSEPPLADRIVDNQLEAKATRPSARMPVVMSAASTA